MLPKPEIGLVICYSYLWKEEALDGKIEGKKDRPCIILLVSSSGNQQIVTVAPITHSSPKDLDSSIEIPFKVKNSLNLDEEKSWIILNEFNIFTWPGFDLRHISKKKEKYDYGFVPPNLFLKIRNKFIELRKTSISREN